MNILRKPTPEDIIELTKKHNLTRAQAAGLISVSVNTWHNWTAKVDTKDHRQMPLTAWELFLLKIDEHPTYKLVERN